MAILKKKTTKAAAEETKEAAPKKTRTTKKAAAAKEEPKAEATTATIILKNAHRVILRPVVTEKAALAQSANKYTFVVASAAKKNQIAAAVKEMYGVDPVAVNVINVEGHRISFGRNKGKKSDVKKAIVTLPAGKTISVHEGV